MISRLVRCGAFAASLTLAGLALTPRAEAFGCVSGSWQWKYVDVCCFAPEGDTRKMIGLQCVGGVWRFTTSYICTSEPCTA